MFRSFDTKLDMLLSSLMGGLVLTKVSIESEVQVQHRMAHAMAGLVASIPQAVAAECLHFLIGTPECQPVEGAEIEALPVLDLVPVHAMNEEELRTVPGPVQPSGEALTLGSSVVDVRTEKELHTDKPVGLVLVLRLPSDDAGTVWEVVSEPATPRSDTLCTPGAGDVVIELGVAATPSALSESLGLAARQNTGDLASGIWHTLARGTGRSVEELMSMLLPELILPASVESMWHLFAKWGLRFLHGALRCARASGRQDGVPGIITAVFNDLSNL